MRLSLKTRPKTSAIVDLTADSPPSPLRVLPNAHSAPRANRLRRHSTSSEEEEEEEEESESELDKPVVSAAKRTPSASEASANGAPARAPLAKSSSSSGSSSSGSSSSSGDSSESSSEDDNVAKAPSLAPHMQPAQPARRAKTETAPELDEYPAWDDDMDYPDDGYGPPPPNDDDDDDDAEADDDDVKWEPASAPQHRTTRAVIDLDARMEDEDRLGAVEADIRQHETEMRRLQASLDALQQLRGELRRKLESAVASDDFGGEDYKWSAAVRETLRRVFGFEAFRELQLQVINCTMAGKDALVVLPTGSGKSLLFQLPAAVQGGLTVVVSPLLSLSRSALVARLAL